MRASARAHDGEAGVKSCQPLRPTSGTLRKLSQSGIPRFSTSQAESGRRSSYRQLAVIVGFRLAARTSILPLCPRPPQFVELTQLVHSSTAGNSPTTSRTIESGAVSSSDHLLNVTEKFRKSVLALAHFDLLMHVRFFLLIPATALAEVYRYQNQDLHIVEYLNIEDRNVQPRLSGKKT